MTNKKRIAVLAAINDYPYQINDLKGCLNDSNGWLTRLQTKFNFTDIATLWDSKATLDNVKIAIETQFSKCTEYDTFSFIYSGHGTWVPDDDGDEADGKDEAICLYDGLLKDDYFRQLFKDVPANLNIVMISDSCHSGTMTKHLVDTGYMKPRFMAPPQEYLEMEYKLRQGSRLFDSARAQTKMNEILITGCKDTQFSADAFIDGKYYGALSYYCFKVIDNNPTDITYDSFYKQLRKYLPNYEYDQIPQLECSPENRNRPLFG